MRPEVSSRCPYCNKMTRRGSKRTIAPDRSLNDRWWHDHCMTRFIAWNIPDEGFNANRYVERLRENLTELIKEVNVKEAQYHYQKITV